MRENVRRAVLYSALASQAYLLGAHYESIGILALQFMFSVWILAPFILFHRFAKTRGTDEQVLLSATLLLAMHAFFLSVFFKSASSTSAIMFIFTPAYELIPLAVLYLPPGRRAMLSVLASLAVGVGAVHGVNKLTKEASNPETPAARLESIATGGWGWLKGVKEALAGNPSTPVALLEKLAMEGDEYLLRDLGNNPSAPPELLARIAEKHTSYTALWGVARNPRTPPASLKLLAERMPQDELYKYYVLPGLAANPSLPRSVSLSTAPAPRR